jgi:hypothetical protein
MMTRKDYVETASILNKFINKIDSLEFQDLMKINFILLAW